MAEQQSVLLKDSTAAMSCHATNDFSTEESPDGPRIDVCLNGKRAHPGGVNCPGDGGFFVFLHDATMPSCRSHVHRYEK